ncbi:hypothetical protein IJH24_01480 [Candidatus Saccharibacteria bacterium]|nr:hypothetical protein [Candidatus Saccharibacteria bacterium]
MIRQIAVYLTLSQSKEIRELLAKNDFVIYKVNSLTRKIDLIEGNQNIFFLDNDERYNGYICLYNGNLGFEDMGIDRKNLERSAAVRKIRDELDKTRADSAP